MGFHHQILSEELERRIKKNPRYSLRAFASCLGIHPSALSRVLAGKQELSMRSSIDLLLKLNLTKEEKRLFLQSIIEEKRQKETQTLEEAVDLLGLRSYPVEIDPETYAKLADLKCLSLIALTYVEEFRSEPEWIAERLSISEQESRDLIDLLLRMGLLERRGGRLVSTNQHLTAIESESCEDADLPQASRKFVEDLRQRRGDLLDPQSRCGMTMTVDTERIPIANRMISDFVRTLSDFLNTGSRDCVYQLSVQMLPIHHAGGRRAEVRQNH